jgi:hypothetical protein
MPKLIIVIVFNLRYIIRSLIIIILGCSKYYKSWFSSILYINISLSSLVSILLFISILLRII